MSKQVKLTARPRAESGSNAVKNVRNRGGVPAVIYGATAEPRNLEINLREIEQILAHAAGENILVDLHLEEDGKQVNRLSLIQEVQHHPVTGGVLHVDFHAVSMNETIQAEVPIEPVGDADGVKNAGGVLEQSLRSLPIECLPQDLPDIIKLDVSGLKLGEAFHVSDLSLPAGVTATVDAELTVIRVAEPKVSAEPTAAAEEQPTAPEVIKEKKAEEDGEQKDNEGK